tara:strand:- start:126 stop:245 length:120 start_codon:yes stop_codon:yes gene_type:complete
MGKILYIFKFFPVDDLKKANLIGPFNEVILVKEINFLND